MYGVGQEKLGGNWQEDLQNAMRAVRTSNHLTLLPSNIMSREGFLEHIWLKMSRENLNWGGKLYLHHSRKKSYQRE
jgi:predicted GH43/DUF377 family glycosyl hydrolase